MGFLAALPGMLGLGGAAGAGAAAAPAAAGIAGLGHSLGGGMAAAGALGAGAGAMGLLANPFVSMGIGAMLPTLLGKRGGGEEEQPDLPEQFSDRQQLRPPAPNVQIPTAAPGADIYRPGIDPEQRYFSGRYYAQGGLVDPPGYRAGFSPERTHFAHIGGAGGPPGAAPAPVSVPPLRRSDYVQPHWMSENMGGNFPSAPDYEAIEEMLRQIENGAPFDPGGANVPAPIRAPAPPPVPAGIEALRQGPMPPFEALPMSPSAGGRPNRWANMQKVGSGNLAAFGAPQMMGFGPIQMQEGGLATLAQNDAAGPPEGREQLVLEAARVIKGTSEADPRMVLGQFLAAFGQEALNDLIQRVESGEMDPVVADTGGKIEGQGDGMSDEIPGTIGGKQDVLLSDGEFVIPADVVSGLGNGSSDAGAQELEAMMQRVRAARTGTPQQAPAIEPKRTLPV
jgi:hypothetical protein